MKYKVQNLFEYMLLAKYHSAAMNKFAKRQSATIALTENVSIFRDECDILRADQTVKQSYEFLIQNPSAKAEHSLEENNFDYIQNVHCACFAAKAFKNNLDIEEYKDIYAAGFIIGVTSPMGRDIGGIYTPYQKSAYDSLHNRADTNQLFYKTLEGILTIGEFDGIHYAHQGCRPQ